MSGPPHDETDRQIEQLWRAGLRSAREVGLRLGLPHMQVGLRIARMIKSGAWPFGSAALAARVQGTARALLDPVRGRSGSSRSSNGGARNDRQPLVLSFTLGAELHNRLRAHCRETGATVSETVAEALGQFLRGRDGTQD